ncbi:hypothetical protein B0H11DRAFT_1909965 [Mycena galericulata]|nr:hypothetical protein B0H11DRAFT_1909965 [Mycena galericulata]
MPTFVNFARSEISYDCAASVPPLDSYLVFSKKNLSRNVHGLRTWIHSFFDPATPVVLVADPALSGGDPEAWRPALKTVFPNWVCVCPSLISGGRGCMHMKYMLLFKKTGALRVVIGSGNLVPHEWRDIENDFPPATPGVETVKLRVGENPSEAFPAVLVAALRATGVEEALASMIRQGHTALPLPTLVPSADSAKAGTKSTALEYGG